MGLPFIDGTVPTADDFNLLQPRAYDGSDVGDYLNGMKPMTALVQLAEYSGSATVVRMIVSENVLFYQRDDNDITTPANINGSVLIDQLGRRWKRLQGEVTAFTETVQAISISAEAARVGAIAAAESVGSFTTLARANSKLAASGIPLDKGIYVTADIVENLGFWVNRAGVLVRESTTTLPAVAADVSALNLSFKNIVPNSNTLVPLVYDAVGNVAIWLDTGMLAAIGLSPSLLAIIRTALDGTITATSVPEVRNIVLQSSTLVPLSLDDAGNVATWLDNGFFSAKGLSSQLLSAIMAALPVSDTYTALTASPSYKKTIISTDGRCLFQWRAKRATLKQTGAGLMRFALTGDSWTEGATISQQLITRWATDYGKSGEGWLNAGVSGPHTGVTMSKSGWTMYDANIDAGAPTLGSGPDGFAASATGTTATYSLSLKTQTLRIFYWDGLGTFRYRVDSGAWVSVVCGGTNSKTSLLISSLSDTTHTFDIDLTGNTGTVTFHGFYATRTAPGVEFQKLGNGGCSGSDFMKFTNQIGYFASTLAPDVVCILLGTNDSRLSKTVQSFKDGLLATAQAWRAALPNVGIVLVMPCENGTPGTIPFAQYRDAMLSIAQANGYDYYSAADDFSSFAVENTLGTWGPDFIHLADPGSYRLANSLNTRLLGI